MKSDVDILGSVVTVSGMVPAASLGVTLPHEHVLIDLSCYWDPIGGEEAEAPDRDITMEMLGRLRHDPVGVTRSNLILDDASLAVSELTHFVAAGGSTIVDLTPRGTSPQVAKVAEVAARAGVQLVLGTGYYVDGTHPDSAACLAEDDLTEQFVNDVEQGIDGTRLRAGVIGEMGTSDPITPLETKFLRAAARAQSETGVALNVHLEEWGANGHEILNIVEAAGGIVDKTVLSHLDSRLDLDYHMSLIQRGAWVEYDLFGTEDYRIREGRGNPSDHERVLAVAALVENGHGQRLLLSSDVCTRVQLRAYGGHGYSHLMNNVTPMLKDAGLSSDEIHQLLELNPRSMLVVAR